MKNIELASGYNNLIKREIVFENKIIFLISSVL